MIAIFKIIQVFLLATVKYVLTFPYALLIGLNFQQTLISVTLGGIAGFIFFLPFQRFCLAAISSCKDIFVETQSKISSFKIPPDGWLEKRSDGRENLYKKKAG